jgi:hypothetical protein
MRVLLLYKQIQTWVILFLPAFTSVGNPVSSDSPNVTIKWLALHLLLGSFRIQISFQRPAVLIEAYRGFPQLIQAVSGVVS